MIDYKPQRRFGKKLKFTLLEIICVLAIIALVLGFVSSKIGFIPSLVNFNNSVVNIEKVFASATALSVSSGKKVVVKYKDNNFSGSISQMDYTLPSFITISVGDDVYNYYDVRKFYFFPDGSASGPDINLSYKGHTAKIVISKLTGYPIVTID